MGTPDFAVPCFEALCSSDNTVVGVVTQPDKPKGRGHKLLPPPIKEKAMGYGIPVFQPETLRNESFLEELKQLAPDIIIVVSYGKLLPEYILNYPKYGCINVHASLLPKYRGAAPIQQSIINGDNVTGVTTMYMSKALDTGDIILKSEIKIDDNETSGELFEKLADLGAKLLIETLDAVKNGTAPRIKQDDTKSSYAPMLSKDSGHIDWSKPAFDIVNLIRGTNPWPLAYAIYKEDVMKIYKAQPGQRNISGIPGEILGINKKMLEVCCGDGESILVDEIQFKGGKRMKVSSYINGHDIDIGVILK